MSNAPATRRDLLRAAGLGVAALAVPAGPLPRLHNPHLRSRRVLSAHRPLQRALGRTAHSSRLVLLRQRFSFRSRTAGNSPPGDAPSAHQLRLSPIARNPRTWPTSPSVSDRSGTGRDWGVTLFPQDSRARLSNRPLDQRRGWFGG
jgi:hypothetical protein